MPEASQSEIPKKKLMVGLILVIVGQSFPLWIPGIAAPDLGPLELH